MMLKIAKNSLLSLSLIAYASIFGMHEEEIKEHEQAFTTHGVIIVLDDSENVDEKTFDANYSLRRTACGALSIQGLYALHQKAAPVILGKNILRNIITFKNALDAFALENPNTIEAWLALVKKHPILTHANPHCLKLAINNQCTGLKKYLEKEEDEWVKNYARGMYRKAAFIAKFLFSYEDWIIHKIDDHYFLLLPKGYVSDLSIEETSKYMQKKQTHDLDLSILDNDYYMVPSQKTKTPLTETELKIGIKIDHLEKLNETSFYESIFNTNNRSSFLETLQDIFITKQEYLSHKNYTAPKWNIYITRHGSYDNPDNVKIFKNLLAFAESINTKFFSFNSCYAGGKKLQNSYKISNCALEQTYPFIIASAALSDFSSWISIPDVNDEGTITFYQDLATYFNTLKKYPTKNNLTKALDALYNFSRETSNIPNIKLSNQESHKALDTAQSIVIDPIMAQVRTQNLDPITFFKHKKELTNKPFAFLLYAHSINFPLTLPPQKTTFVSMLPGDASHTFEEINAPHYALQNLIASFFEISPEPQKVFWIKKLILNDNEILYDVIATHNIDGLIKNPDNSIMRNYKRNNALYFTKNQCGFVFWDNSFKMYRPQWKFVEKNNKYVHYFNEYTQSLNTYLTYFNKVNKNKCFHNKHIIEPIIKVLEKKMEQIKSRL